MIHKRKRIGLPTPFFPPFQNDPFKSLKLLPSQEPPHCQGSPKHPIISHPDLLVRLGKSPEADRFFSSHIIHGGTMQSLLLPAAYKIDIQICEEICYVRWNFLSLEPFT